MEVSVIGLVFVTFSHMLGSCGVHAQGRMLEPPGRSSMWRLGYDTPINQNDNVLTCGGIKHRWETNKGKCGVCGDPWDTKSRENEAGGKYTSGIISGVFTSGSAMDITIEIAVANGGYFEFRLCANNNMLRPVTEKCLDTGLLSLYKSNATRYYNITDGINTVTVSIPKGLECEQCVLQWKYRTADHYGCDHATSNKEQVCGFGHGLIQTEYFACADISVIPEKDNIDFNSAFNVPIHPGNHGNTTAPRQVPQKRAKRSVMNPDGTISRVIKGAPYIIPVQNFDSLRFNGLSSPGRTLIAPRTPLQWGWSPMSGQRPARIRRRVQIPTRRASITIARRPGFQNGVFQDQRQMFPGGGMSLPTSAGVQQQLARAMNPSEDGMMFTATILRPELRNTFAPRVAVRSIRNHMLSKRLLPKCAECPFDTCLDPSLDVGKIFPGIFVKPNKFLECKNYEKLFSLGKFDVVKDGVPECSIQSTHPRFKRQLPPIRMEDDDIGCCSTRPQVILPLTVQSDNDTFNVVQLPSDRKQLLVQGLCGRDNTTSCPMCMADFNFQWVLVYDPRVDSNPPVSFVPVKFQHYCKCLNPGLGRVGR